MGHRPTSSGLVRMTGKAFGWIGTSASFSVEVRSRRPSPQGGEKGWTGGDPAPTNTSAYCCPNNEHERRQATCSFTIVRCVMKPGSGAMAKNPRKGGGNRSKGGSFTRIKDGDLRQALIKLVEALAPSKSP
jgi:hypothetical protein